MNRTRLRPPAAAPDGPLELLSPAEERRLPPEAKLAATVDGLRAIPPAAWPVDPLLARGLAPLSAGERPALWGWLQSALGGGGWRPLPAPVEAEPGPAAEAERLHRRWERLADRPALARRTLEQELLQRDRLPEDWAWHRARWLYRRVQLGPGTPAACREAALKARASGFYFHPDQLEDGAHPAWTRLRELLDALPPGRLLRLTRLLLQGRPVELLVSPSGWTRLRGWLGRLAGGRGLPLLELPAGSLPGPLPADDRRGPRPIVLHLDGLAPPDLSTRLAALQQEGWLPLLVHGGGPRPPAALNQVDARRRQPEDGTRALLRSGLDPVLPLKEFVRRAERRYIQEVIGLHGGVKARACETLRITRQTLYTKLGRESQ